MVPLFIIDYLVVKYSIYEMFSSKAAGFHEKTFNELDNYPDVYGDESFVVL